MPSQSGSSTGCQSTHSKQPFNRSIIPQFHHTEDKFAKYDLFGIHSRDSQIKHYVPAVYEAKFKCNF